jgi:hypothetical protein
MLRATVLHVCMTAAGPVCMRHADLSMPSGSRGRAWCAHRKVLLSCCAGVEAAHMHLVHPMHVVHVMHGACGW